MKAGILFRAIVLAAVACTASGPSFADEKPKSTQELMHEIFEPIRSVLPLSFSAERFTAKENQAKISAALEQLAKNAHQLESHAVGKDKGFAYVAKSLARDAREVNHWYKKGWYNEARFTLHNMTENCISCHSRVKEKKSFPPGKVFVAEVENLKLPPLELAHLEVVTRQFDEALKNYEIVFRDTKLNPEIAILMDAFADYLKISVRVKSDLKRPQKVLKEMAGRKGTPRFAKRQLEVWTETLTDYDRQKVLSHKQPLVRARKIVDEARKTMDFPRDRDGMVHFTVASALLQRYIEEHPKASADTGEAYYLLGVTETLLGHSFWLSQAESFLETAIRTAPSASYAPKAYAMLEQQLVSGFTGSSGTHMPEDVRDMLEELWELVEKGQKAGS